MNELIKKTCDIVNTNLKNKNNSIIHCVYLNKTENEEDNEYKHYYIFSEKYIKKTNCFNHIIWTNLKINLLSGAYCMILK
jgi:hypothetical protein